MKITQDYNYSGIYCIMNIVNNKQYIGSSRSIYSRWLKHRATLRSGVHSNPHLQAAWNKYGESNFKFSVLEKCSVEELINREQYFISTLKPEYNIMQEAKRTVVTEEIKEHIKRGMEKAKLEGRLHSTKGMKYTPEHIAKLPQNQKGFKCPKRQKGVLLYSLEGELLHKFATLNEAAEFLGITFQKVSWLLLRSRTHIYNNYYLTRTLKE